MTTVNSSRRQGYAMVLVLVFIALVNLFFVLSYKHLSSALRVQTAYRLGRERDEGPIAALAAGLAFLELTTPLAEADGGYGYHYAISIGGETYTVTFTPPSEGEQSWSVHARPDDESSDPAGLRDLRQEIEYLSDAIQDGREELALAYDADPERTQYEYEDNPFYTVNFERISPPPDPPQSPQWQITTRPKLDRP